MWSTFTLIDSFTLSSLIQLAISFTLLKTQNEATRLAGTTTDTGIVSSSHSPSSQSIHQSNPRLSTITSSTSLLTSNSHFTSSSAISRDHSLREGSNETDSSSLSEDISEVSLTVETKHDFIRDRLSWLFGASESFLNNLPTLNNQKHLSSFQSSSYLSSTLSYPLATGSLSSSKLPTIHIFTRDEDESEDDDTVVSVNFPLLSGKHTHSSGRNPPLSPDDQSYSRIFFLPSSLFAIDSFHSDFILRFHSQSPSTSSSFSLSTLSRTMKAGIKSSRISSNISLRSFSS